MSDHSSHTTSSPLQLMLKGYWRSSASWRVRIALELKGLPYEYEAVHLVRDGGEQHKEGFKAESPMSQVPVLMVTREGEPPFSLTQSLAIIQLLDQLAPQHLLLPLDPFKRARTLELAEVINAGTQPLQNLSVLQRLSALGVDRAQWASEVIEKGLTALERLCERHEELRTHAFLMGDAPGLIEACLIPQLYNARRFSVDLSPFKRLLDVEARCLELDAFKRAAPEAQPDAQPSA